MIWCNMLQLMSALEFFLFEVIWSYENIKRAFEYVFLTWKWVLAVALLMNVHLQC